MFRENEGNKDTRQELTLVNYCHPDCVPMMNIMRLPEEEAYAKAYEMAAQTLLGSALMVLQTGTHPGALKDAVCSPAGTTIEAVEELERKGFRAAIMDAMKACADKSRAMSK